MAKRNITFKNSDVHSLFLEAINRITVEDWTKACEHVVKEEQFYREKEGIVDDLMDRFIINLEDTDDDDESDEDNGKYEEMGTDDLDGTSILPPGSLELV